MFRLKDLGEQALRGAVALMRVYRVEGAQVVQSRFQVTSPAAKLDRLETLLAQAALPVAEAAPLFASLLSIPSGERYAPLTLSPQGQKERTIEALVVQLVSLSQRKPLLLILEDAHWSDPSTWKCSIISSMALRKRPCWR